MIRKGIVLAGGKNSRLYPVTRAAPKSLLPIYDKPLIYYSLSVLMLAGVRDILVITTPEGEAAHRRLLAGGEAMGLCLSYRTQPEPRGIADAFLIGRDFIAGAPSALILADNIYYGSGLGGLLQNAARRQQGATVFAYPVNNPKQFGVVSFDRDGRAMALEEKPQHSRSSHAVTGCYFYDGQVCDIAAAIQPSARGELEITDVNREYLRRGLLTVETMGRGTAWFDTGTPKSMAAAADFVRVVQERQGLMISCPEEIAWRNGWIDNAQLTAQADTLANTPYGDYLRQLAAAK